MARIRLVSARLLVVVSLLTACGSEPSQTASVTSSPESSPSPPAKTCGDPHAHVYSPDRLHLLAPCVTVTGTIQLETPEPDGDYHVRLRLDSGQTCAGQPCLNGSNTTEQAGGLVLEPVCENPISQADAVAACQGYHNALVLPPVGSHVAATGPFVLDTDHGWNEIHPLESVAVLSRTSPSPSPGTSPTPSATPTAAPAALAVTITASSYGLVSATTLTGASCTAQARLPSGRISTAAGLQSTMTAGPDGSVSWGYATVANTTKGTGTHTVTCTFQGMTATASAPFTVS